MPGVNCCIAGCPTYSSKAKYPGVSFFKIPKTKEKDEAHNEWGKKLVHIVNRCDKSFDPDKAFICS